MQPELYKRTISQLYLSFVPLIAAIIGFGIGHISYKIYVPIWILHSCLMLVAAWILGAHVIRSQDSEKKELAIAGMLLIVPWILFTVFAGMGPPPDTAAGWVATATEQQVRYCILIGGGVLATLGFALLRNSVKEANENVYSLFGFTAMLIAIPLFIINMAFWGSFLVEAFKSFEASASKTRPDWYAPSRDLFNTISVVDVELTYLATAAFAASLKAIGWFKPTACRIYIIVSLLGFVLNLVPSSSPTPLVIAGYLVSIPAFPFIMPYLMGVNLLRRLGNEE